MDGYGGHSTQEYLLKAAQLLRACKERSYQKLHLQPGHRLLDVGCGPGTDTIPLGVLVGPQGQVIGVDSDSEMVAAGVRKAHAEGVADRVQHFRADACQLPFDACAFDGCRAERLFQHLDNPERALGEMARVTRGGGRVVVLDPDWGTASTDSPDADVERRVAHYRAARFLRNGFAGRQLLRLFKRLNLRDIDCEGYVSFLTTYGDARQILKFDALGQAAIGDRIVTPEEFNRYLSGLSKLDSAGEFFFSVTGMMVSATKP